MTSDSIEYTDGIYANLPIEESQYDRADENNHLKISETDSLEDDVPLLVPLIASVPKTKRTRSVGKKTDKQKKKTRKHRKKRTRKTRIKSVEPLRESLSRN
jgi:hypothetical protein